MKFTTIAKALIAVAIFALLFATSAQAQILRANVPFEFRVDEKAFPAGNYVIRMDPMSKRVTIGLPDGKLESFLVTTPLSWKTEQENGMLVFNRYEQTYFLSRFKAPATSAGHELLPSKAEREYMVRAGEARHLALIRVVAK